MDHTVEDKLKLSFVDLSFHQAMLKVFLTNKIVKPKSKESKTNRTFFSDRIEEKIGFITFDQKRMLMDQLQCK